MTMKTWANIFLGAWLVLAGLVQLGGLSLPHSRSFLAVLGVATGILLFFANSSEKITTQIAGILLGAWLVAGGLFALAHIRFTGSSVLLAMLAVAAGIMVLLTRR
jgi:hypothetical protein